MRNNQDYFKQPRALTGFGQRPEALSSQKVRADLTGREGGNIFIPTDPVMKDQRNEPVTKGDLVELRRGLQADLKHLGEEIRQEFQSDLNKLREDIDRKIESAKEDIMRYTGILDEALRRDVFGAREQEVADLVQSRDDHERRIRRLENGRGLVAA